MREDQESDSWPDGLKEPGLTPPDPARVDSAPPSPTRLEPARPARPGSARLGSTRQSVRFGSSLPIWGYVRSALPVWLGSARLDSVRLVSALPSQPGVVFAWLYPSSLGLSSLCSTLPACGCLRSARPVRLGSAAVSSACVVNGAHGVSFFFCQRRSSRGRLGLSDGRIRSIPARPRRGPAEARRASLPT